MKRLLLFILADLLVAPRLFANEGMWPPDQLPKLSAELKRLGLEIDPSSLSSLTEHPMNAVISLGGCTASFVSPNGLIVTNHHCALGSIQHNSTPENNLMERGFLAETQEDELPAAPGSRVYVTVEFRDVTSAVLDELPESLTGKQRFDEIDRREKAMVAECEKTPNMRCRIASYHGGLQYSLVRQLELRDVRLVYAPASGIGVFGGDIDNWMWPRHTGDFSFYRAYVGPEGKSADFSRDNVPYRPAHYLRVSREGVAEGNLVLVAGYPGNTARYRLASEVQDTFEWSYPRRIQMYREWLEVIEGATASDEAARIKYANLVAGLNNVLKNNQGMMDGFAKSDMLEQKKKLESDLADWIRAGPERQATYGEAVSKLTAELAEIRKNRERDLYFGGAGRSTLLGVARRVVRLAREKQKPDLDREPGYQERDFDRIKQSMERMERTFDPRVDKAVWKYFILKYHELPAGSRVAEFDDWFGLKPGQNVEKALDKKLDEIYRKTNLGDLNERLVLLDAKPWDLDSSKDPFIRLANHLYERDIREENEDKLHAGNLQQLRPDYMRVLIAFLESRGRQVYPDANSTLRVTFGTIQGYQPRDAVTYTPFTTLEGIVEKDTGEDPFNTPLLALEAMKAKNYGAWKAASLGSVPVNFLSTCDTTGGNSGSPTLNGRGELVGLLFDGNYESMLADWDFLPAITRSIHVDVRYMLWVMDVVDNAHRLLLEMGIQPEKATR